MNARGDEINVQDVSPRDLPSLHAKEKLESLRSPVFVPALVLPLVFVIGQDDHRFVLI